MKFLWFIGMMLVMDVFIQIVLGFPMWYSYIANSVMFVLWLGLKFRKPQK